MKKKEIESKLTKAKERLVKVTAKVTRLESRLEKVRKKKAEPVASNPAPPEPPKKTSSSEKKPKPSPSAKSVILPSSTSTATTDKAIPESRRKRAKTPSRSPVKGRT